MTRSASAITSDPSLTPLGVAALDVNGDSILDLGVLIFPEVTTRPFPQGFVTTLIGTGTGSFTATGQRFMVGQLPRGIATGDFDEDGAPDLAVANNGSDDVSILLGDGQGGFAPAVSIPTGTQPLTPLVEDLDRDGHLDLAVTHSFGSSISLFYGTGQGTFQAGVPLPASGSTRVVAASDLDGNGFVDLVSGAGGPLVFLAAGARSFLPAGRIALPNTSALALADMNVDGIPDVFVGDTRGGVSLVYGAGGGTFEDIVTMPEVGRFLEAADLDGDYVQDIVHARDDLAGGTRQLSVRRGTGQGGFNAATRFSVPHESAGVQFADWNRDGLVDILSTNVESVPFSNPLVSASVHLAAASGSWAQGAVLALTDAPVRSVTGDLDGDGFSEWIVAFPFAIEELSPGPGQTVARRSLLSAATAIADVAVADIDHDGLLDLLVLHTPGDFEIRPGTGQGGFGAPLPLQAPPGARSFDVRDMNADGRRDLVFREFFAVSVLYQTASGFGAPQRSASIAGSLSPVGKPRTADVNGDGILDVLLGVDTLIVLLGKRQGGFEEPQEFAGMTTDLVACDVNRDGLPDIVRVGAGEFAIHQNRATAPAGVVAYGTGTPGCRGTHLAFGNTVPRVGEQDFRYTCNHAPPFGTGFAVVSGAPDVAGTPLFGFLVHLDVFHPFFFILASTADSNGIASLPAPIPNVSALAGLRFYRQWLWTWPAGCSPSPLGISSSRGVEITIQG